MTILFIDDDPDDTELFCEAVEYLNKSEFIAGRKKEIDCVAANNGCIAVDLLAQLEELPVYIFLDINMPVMGGRECLKQLKSNPTLAHVPVIMLSTALRAEDVEEFKAMGAIDCIVKPTGFKELVKVLSRFVYDL